MEVSKLRLRQMARTPQSMKAIAPFRVVVESEDFRSRVSKLSDSCSMNTMLGAKDMDHTPAPSRVTAGVRRASLRTGAFEFIPVPFVDEWLIRKERRKIAERVLQDQGIKLDKEALELLSGKRRSFISRVGGWIKGLFFKPLRKIFRTVFFWFTLRRSAMTAMETYFLSRFLAHPSIGVVSKNGHLGAEAAGQLSAAFRQVVHRIDLRLAAEVLRVVWHHRGRGKTATATEWKNEMDKRRPGFLERFDAETANAIQSFAKT